jgi:hypothetical protein
VQALSKTTRARTTTQLRPPAAAGVPGGILGLLGMAEEGCCFWDAIGKVRIYEQIIRRPLLFKFKQGIEYSLFEFGFEYSPITAAEYSIYSACTKGNIFAMTYPI